jgi:hypothetical protein
MTCTVAVLQSNYLPWKGYFDIIHDADLFIFYDDVQYTKNDWRNRNKVKVPGGTAWITVPVGTGLDRRICDVEIRDQRWQVKHWKTFRQYYSGSPYYPDCAEFLRELYLERRWNLLSELNQHAIRTIARDFLGLKTRFADSRSYAPKGRRLARLLDVLRAVGASRYISGPSARTYVDAEAFGAAGIELEFKSYDGYPSYAQQHLPFDHSVTIVDLLCNAGPAAAFYIWGWRQHPERLSASATPQVRAEPRD